jgi:xylulokinase
LEGTAFAMRDVVDRLGTLGVQTDRLRLMGGGARNAIWCQMRCDVSGRPADALTDSDASAMGAAVLAAVAAGSIPDITTGCSALALDLTTFEPDDQPRSAYDDAYAAYRSAFDTLEPYWVSTSRPLRDDS